MRKIDITECHKILLENAKIFYSICERHHIPCYMLGGTMLGAIRHKGFIPWDDDMDFGVPREYYGIVSEIMEKELPPHLQWLSYENSDSIFYGFAKITDTNTIIGSSVMHQPSLPQMGISLDVFPLDRCDRKSKYVYLLYGLIRLQTLIFVPSTKKTWYKSMIKGLLRKVVPFDQRYLLKHIDRIISHRPSSGECLANFYGRWKEKEIIPLTYYGTNHLYVFEDTLFQGLRDYDKYLGSLYGNYMRIPPKNEQVAHENDLYIK